MSNYSDKESQYIYLVSRPGLGSDPLFGSDRDSGCDIKYLYKEQFKEFGKLMKDRDNELEDNDEKKNVA